MKLKIIATLIIINLSTCILALDTLSVDTINLHSVSEVNNLNSFEKHLVIKDTVKVTVVLEKKTVTVEPKSDFTKKIIIALVVLFIILSIYNAKRNKNIVK